MILLLCILKKHGRADNEYFVNILRKQIALDTRKSGTKYNMVRLNIFQTLQVGKNLSTSETVLGGTSYYANNIIVTNQYIW